MKNQQRLGKYEIIDEIGRGGFGAVYEAVDTSLDRTVALKVLAPHLLWEPAFADRFRQEARAAAGLRHPNIVVIHGIGEAEGNLYLAMEYLEGQTLGTLIEQQGRLALPEVADITGQVASALDYAHERGLIHRDVKPNNILVDDAGHVTLTDFGLVRAADGTKYTTTGHIMGTPEYMAPEQCDPKPGATFDHRLDVYALGIVIYQMVTGRVPFRAETPLSTLRGHVDQVPPSPAEANPEITPALEAILLKALAKSPDQRYDSAGAFAEALSDEVQRLVEEQKKEERLARLHEDAGKLVAAQEWARALAVCGQILDLAPDDPYVGDLLAQANEGLMQQRSREAEEAKLGPVYEQAVTLLEEDRLEESIEHLEQIAAVREDYRDVAELLASVRRRLEEAEAEKQERLEALYTEAVQACATLTEAVRQIRMLDPDYPDPEGILQSTPIVCPQCGTLSPAGAANCYHCDVSLIATPKPSSGASKPVEHGATRQAGEGTSDTTPETVGKLVMLLLATITFIAACYIISTSVGG